MHEKSSGAFDRHFWISLFVAAAVLLPRAAWICTAHNECFDSDYHLRRGFAFLTGTRNLLADSSTDPPLGQAILVLPMYVLGCTPDKPIHDYSWVAGEEKPGELAPTPERARLERLQRKNVLYGNRLKPETLILILGLWKSILFLPCLCVIFYWCRKLYNVWAAYLSLALILVDPTFAANIPIMALDSFGIEGIIITCFLYWRYFQRQTRPRLLVAAVSTAASLLIKHTAVALPGIFVLYCIYYWIWRPWREGTLGASATGSWIIRRQQFALALLVGALTLWALLGFDVSAPIDQVWQILPSKMSPAGERFRSILQERMPAGIYVGCFISGWKISRVDFPAMIFGRRSPNGFWYYFPGMMTYKVPIGIFIVLAIALVSLFRKRFIRNEQTVLLPLAAFALMLITSRLNYSFRHFLPAYVFMLMWAGRIGAVFGTWLIAAAWAGVAIAVAHVLTFGPDQISYLNWPRHRVEMQITDSNLDYGCALRQVNNWVHDHPDAPRPIYVMQATGKAGVNGRYWLNDDIHLMYRGAPLPPKGTLIIFPAYMCGLYDLFGGEPFYKALWPVDPEGWVAHAMPAYDLSKAHRH